MTDAARLKTALAALAIIADPAPGLDAAALSATARAALDAIAGTLSPPAPKLKTRADVADALAATYSKKFGGTVWSAWDDARRKYSIRGEGLPAHPDLAEQYPNGWSLLDFLTPTEARTKIKEESDYA